MARLYPTNTTFALDQVTTTYEDGSPVETAATPITFKCWWDERMLSPRDMLEMDVRRQAVMLCERKLAEGDTGVVNGEAWEVLSVQDVWTGFGVDHYEVRLQRVEEAR